MSFTPRLDVDIEPWNSELQLDPLNTYCLDNLGIGIGNRPQYQVVFPLLPQPLPQYRAPPLRIAKNQCFSPFLLHRSPLPCAAFSAGEVQPWLLVSAAEAPRRSSSTAGEAPGRAASLRHAGKAPSRATPLRRHRGPAPPSTGEAPGHAAPLRAPPSARPRVGPHRSPAPPFTGEAPGRACSPAPPSSDDKARAPPLHWRGPRPRRSPQISPRYMDAGRSSARRRTALGGGSPARRTELVRHGRRPSSSSLGQSPIRG